MKLLKSFLKWIDPYENYEPKPTLPTFDFSKAKERAKYTPSVKTDIVLPENVKEKITVAGVKYEKRTDMGTYIEFENWGEKKALLTESEMNEILKLYPKMDKTAMVVTKRAWSKDASVIQTIAELKKVNLNYGKTYVKAMRTIFNKSRVVETA